MWPQPHRQCSAAGDLTSLAFADVMKSDLAQDGVLNGVGRDANGNAVALQIGGVALAATIYRHEVAFYAVIRVRAETEGALNSTQEEQARIVSFLPAFVAYNDATNSLLDASPLVALDEGGPVVTIGYPSLGFTLTNNNGMAGFVHDPVGILMYGTVMLIDGVLYTPFAQSIYSQSLYQYHRVCEWYSHTHNQGDQQSRPHFHGQRHCDLFQLGYCTSPASAIR